VEFLAPYPNPSWSITPSGLTTTAYSMCLELPSISGDCLSFRNQMRRHAAMAGNQ